MRKQEHCIHYCIAHALAVGRCCALLACGPQPSGSSTNLEWKMERVGVNILDRTPCGSLPMRKRQRGLQHKSSTLPVQYKNRLLLVTTSCIRTSPLSPLRNIAHKVLTAHTVAVFTNLISDARVCRQNLHTHNLLLPLPDRTE